MIHWRAKWWIAGPVTAGAVGAAVGTALAWWAGLTVGGAFALLWLVALRRDVSARNDVHEDLRVKMAFLEAQVNASADGMLVVDEQNRRILTNSRMLEIFKVPQHIAHDPDDTLMLRHVTSLNKNPEQFFAKVRYLYDHPHEKSFDELELKDGTILDRYSSPVIGKHGEYHGRIWYFRDITAKRQAEEEMRKLSQVVKQTPTSVLVTDLKGNIEYVNPAFTDNYGYQPQEVLGRHISLIRAASAPQEMFAQVWRVLGDGREWRGELQNQRKNGEITWQLANVAPLRNAHGQVTHYIAINENITELKAMEDKLRLAALTDKLTGLPNRTLFSDRLQQAVLRTKRNKSYHFAVLFLDFDRFKTINDSLGHEIGDQLLKEIAQRLRATMREGDSLSRANADGVAARLGGDEFVLLLDDLKDVGAATIVADRLINVLSRPYHLREHEICSTVSIGVVTSQSGEGSAEDILRDADIAMYEAKLAGKGRYVMFDASMHDRVKTHLQMENDLRWAIGAKQMFLLYQPIVSLKSGQIDGFEALVRWNHPQRGVVSPSEFIPVAEDTGLIIPLGEWVLRQACAQMVHWGQTMGAAAPGNIRVNLSRHQLVLADFPALLKQLLADSGMRPDRLRLEMTESAVMKDAAAAVRMLHAIRDLGVKLDLDDFGTGYSSLTCLRQFPIDGLKIDRSFVSALDHGREHVALLQALTQLALNLRLAVVAEGVETLDQAVKLQSLGCDFGQGFLFSEPLTDQQVVDFRLQPSILPSLKEALSIGAA
jgi:diguanylate cyclase (GGDEF)-like protein/PAS domain S-box-containing protein